MKDNPIYLNGFHNAESKSSSLWKWKGIDLRPHKPENNLYPIPQFLQETGRKMDDVVLGPGVGAGAGCGVGLGFGVVGAAGLGASGLNRLSMVFGIGIGCGVGVGVGYGQGFGGGFSLKSLRHYLLDPKPKSGKRVRVQI